MSFIIILMIVGYALCFVECWGRAFAWFDHYFPEFYFKNLIFCIIVSIFGPFSLFGFYDLYKKYSKEHDMDYWGYKLF